MKLRASHIPLRLATGAFILNAGLDHLKMPEEQAGRLHGMATGAYPGLKRLDPAPFGQVLAAGEVALGAALLVPFIPSSLVGLGLAAFSGSLLGLYAKTPGVHKEGSLRPTDQGIALAKDTWMAGIAAALVLDSATSSLAKRKELRWKTKATKAEELLAQERSAKESLAQERSAKEKSAKEKSAKQHAPESSRQAKGDQAGKVHKLARGAKGTAKVGATVARAVGAGNAGRGLRRVAGLARLVA